VLVWQNDLITVPHSIVNMCILFPHCVALSTAKSINQSINLRLLAAWQKNAGQECTINIICIAMHRTIIHGLWRGPEELTVTGPTLAHGGPELDPHPTVTTGQKNEPSWQWTPWRGPFVRRWSCWPRRSWGTPATRHSSSSGTGRRRRWGIWRRSPAVLTRTYHVVPPRRIPQCHACTRHREI